ncbi:hypothetical protein BDZ97DRAFT_1626701, partial [Flammula alnicola]
VRARLYSVLLANPIFIPVLTRTAGHHRFPIMEEAFSGMRTQPHIHDVIVTVQWRGRWYRFHIFVKNHRLLPMNPTVSAMVPGCQWNGDIVI